MREAGGVQARSHMLTEIVLKPIGTVHSPFKAPPGTPIQPGAAAGIQGMVEVFPEYREGLKDLEGFSHLILLYYFHLAPGFSLLVQPFLDDQKRGLFATGRRPCRTPSVFPPCGWSASTAHGSTSGRWISWTAPRFWTSSLTCPGLIAGTGRPAAGWLKIWTGWKAPRTTAGLWTEPFFDRLRLESSVPPFDGNRLIR